MFKRLFFLISIVLVLGLVGNASAALVGQWTFDDGTANDSSGGGHHGTLTSGDETTSISIVYDANRGSNVLDVDNPAGHTINSVVDCGGGEWADISTTITLMCWTKLENINVEPGNQHLMSHGAAYQLTTNGISDGIRAYMTGLFYTSLAADVPIMGSWHHVAVTYDSDAWKRLVYVDGRLATFDAPPGRTMASSAENFVIGGRLNPTYDHRGWDGRIDDVQIYNHVLSEGEIRGINGIYSAYDPNPGNEAENVLETLPTLTWKPGGKVAATGGHKLYFGTSQALVEANDVSVYIDALDSNSYSGAPMSSLALGTTYYWRVIEVNDVNWPDEIWQFSTLPLEATEPDPPDGAKYVSISRTKVGWKAGVTATNHAVYFGTSEALIDANDASVYKGTFAVTSDPNWSISPALTANETYYWRIDVNAPGVYQGDVWSFTTMAPTGDPNFVAWWKLDEMSKDGKHIFDASGNEHYGTLEIPNKDRPIVIVYDDELDSNVAFFPHWPATRINCGGGGTGTWADFAGGYSMTIAVWFKTDGLFSTGYQYVCSKEDLWRISRWSSSRNMRFGLGDGAGSFHPESIIGDDGEWHHIAGVYDGTTQYIYWDGTLGDSRPWTAPLQYVLPADLDPTDTFDVIIGGNQGWATRVWDGWISDVRLFDRALSPLEIALMGVKDPNKAWWPYPANNAVDVSDSPLTLTWRSGVKVATTGGHRVYFGTDKALVDANDVSVDNGPQDVNYLDVGELAFDMTYYWRVDESNGATTWRGLDWTFDMANFKLFDDFESYDFGANLITDTWELVEGPFPGYFTGAVISLGSGTDPIHGGDQSMKYVYDNDDTMAYWYYSEAYRDFGGNPQNWSYATGGVKSLRLYFYGETGNYPDDMYVVLDDGGNESMKLYDRDLSDLKAGEWKQWDIDLSWFTAGANNVNLASVDRVCIGFGERGEEYSIDTHLTGTVYFDDFRVYPPHCVPDRLKPDGDVTEDCFVDYEDADQMAGDWLDYDYTITPSNPTDANLLGYWNFDDGTANDSSGKGHHGTLVTGGDGTSLSIVDDAYRGSKVLEVINVTDANNGVVNCGGDANDVGDPCWANLVEQVSVAAWFTLDSINTGNQYMITKGNTWQITSRGTDDGIRSYYEPLDPANLTTTRPVMDNKWHHVAITYDSTVPKRKLYLDGREAGSDEPTGGTLNVHWDSFVIGGRLNTTYIQRGWVGKIDEVRIYDDVLTHEEVVYLMTGTTSPVYFDVYSPANITDAGDPCDSRFVNFKDYDVLADNWLTELLWPSGW